MPPFLARSFFLDLAALGVILASNDSAENILF
jgi:hypothetical protein